MAKNFEQLFIEFEALFLEVRCLLQLDAIIWTTAGIANLFLGYLSWSCHDNASASLAFLFGGSCIWRGVGSWRYSYRVDAFYLNRTGWVLVELWNAYVVISHIINGLWVYHTFYYLLASIYLAAAVASPIMDRMFSRRVVAHNNLIVDMQTSREVLKQAETAYAGRYSMLVKVVGAEAIVVIIALVISFVFLSFDR